MGAHPVRLDFSIVILSSIVACRWLPSPSRTKIARFMSEIRSPTSIKMNPVRLVLGKGNWAGSVATHRAVGVGGCSASWGASGRNSSSSLGGLKNILCGRSNRPRLRATRPESSPGLGVGSTRDFHIPSASSASAGTPTELAIDFSISLRVRIARTFSTGAPNRSARALGVQVLGSLTYISSIWPRTLAGINFISGRDTRAGVSLDSSPTGTISTLSTASESWIPFTERLPVFSHNHRREHLVTTLTRDHEHILIGFSTARSSTPGQSRLT
mmetsp:Transcript_445/g.817  ORF Transcript_445/g.817 Transcript_445/m.817 type:complete len:271 (+) Transcript_445:783-1595(+)